MIKLRPEWSAVVCLALISASVDISRASAALPVDIRVEEKKKQILSQIKCGVFFTEALSAVTNST
jgi:hypothetical protein